MIGRVASSRKADSRSVMVREGAPSMTCSLTKRPAMIVWFPARPRSHDRACPLIRKADPRSVMVREGAPSTACSAGHEKGVGGRPSRPCENSRAGKSIGIFTSGSEDPEEIPPFRPLTRCNAERNSLLLLQERVFTHPASPTMAVSNDNAPLAAVISRQA
jgi:hypothetical protein